MVRAAGSPVLLLRWGCGAVLAVVPGGAAAGAVVVGVWLLVGRRQGLFADDKM